MTKRPTAPPKFHIGMNAIRDELVQILGELSRAASQIESEEEINVLLDHIGGIPGSIRKFMGGPVGAMGDVERLLAGTQQRLARFRGQTGDATETFKNATTLLKKR